MFLSFWEMKHEALVCKGESEASSLRAGSRQQPLTEGDSFSTIFRCVSSMRVDVDRWKGANDELQGACYEVVSSCGVALSNMPAQLLVSLAPIFNPLYLSLLNISLATWRAWDAHGMCVMLSDCCHFCPTGRRRNSKTGRGCSPGRGM